MHFCKCLSLGLFFGTFVCGQQVYLGGDSVSVTTQPLNGTFQPLGSFSALSGSEFTLLEHPAFPRHGVRIKKSKFCDETVDAYTGYIDIEARHLFFYFFESRNDPDKDDVIFWTNGGPGGSSSIGLFMELGPCRVDSPTTTKPFEYSWNANANVFFIDQPIGVGFSYADYGETVSSTEEGARDIAAFVAIFFEHFVKFKGRALHLAGESYGGRYIPAFAAEIYDQNARIVANGLAPVNLSSIMIGNGLPDFFNQILGGYDMLCTGASIPPILPIQTCVRMKQVIPRCEKWIKESCVDQLDYINCGAAMDFCSTEFGFSQEDGTVFMATGRNPFDISKICEGDILESLCYPISKNVTAYLSQPSVHTSLGVDPSVPLNFSSISLPVAAAFDLSNDILRVSHPYITALLERGVRVLVYAGTYDLTCNWVGGDRWTRKLEWSGQKEFSEAPFEVWEVDGERAGRVRKAQGLSFVTIEGAGHMTPYDKPKESLEMADRWIRGEI